MPNASFTRSVRAFALAAISTTLSFFAVAETSYPLSVEDGMGNPLVIKQQPDKISSKTLFTDEIFLSLLTPERLTSITNIASDSNFSNIAGKLPSGVPQLDLNVEAIISNYPDLVFAANWSDAGKIAQLKQAGIQVYLVKTPYTLEGIEAEINKLAEILNVSDSGETLIAGMQQQLNTLASQKAQLANQQFQVLDYNSWGTASGVDTTWHAVLEASGLINAAARYEQGDFGQVPMSKELIVSINPDVLFLPGWIYGDDSAANAFRDNVLSDPALKSVKAIQSGRVYQVPEALRGTYSQYIVDTVQFVIETASADLN